MPRRTKYSNFGEVVSNALTTSNSTASSLAQGMSTTQAHVSQMMTGARGVTPKWADLVADTLKLQVQQRAELHRAAALDKGYKLDLSPHKG
jgi:plasmid maintenance system antidote protein VapI